MEESVKTPPMENQLRYSDRDFRQVRVEVEQLLLESIKVLGMLDGITVQLQVLAQSLSEQE